MRPCICEKVKKGAPYTQDQCLYCWLYWHRGDKNRQWGGDGATVQIQSQNASVPARVKRGIDPNKPRLSIADLVDQRKK